MGNAYSIYRYGHHDLRDNTNYQLFILQLEECYTTLHQDLLCHKLSLPGLRVPGYQEKIDIRTIVFSFGDPFLTKAMNSLKKKSLII